MTGTGNRVKNCVCVWGGGGGGRLLSTPSQFSIYFKAFFFTHIIFSPLGRLGVAYIHVG